MAECIERYLSKDRHYRVVDVGSRRVGRQRLTHRELLRDYDHTYLGVDIKPGPNVGAVMRKPYRIPVPSGSVDVVLSGQTFEHIQFPWASMLEIARILKPGGYVFLTAPSRGHVHAAVDCWRYYPDGLRALATFAGLEVVEARTDFPPPKSEGRRHDYARIDTEAAYWGDSVGVFCKPEHYPFWRIGPIREVIIWWANQRSDL
jgi:SAM-dependent methyltransferase